MKRLAVNEAKPLRGSDLAQRQHVCDPPRALDRGLHGEHQVQVPNAALLEFPLVHQDSALRARAEASDSPVGALLADSVELPPPAPRGVVPCLGCALLDPTPTDARAALAATMPA